MRRRIDTSERWAPLYVVWELTLRCDLAITLERETCDWLTAPATAWLTETVSQAVRAEFDLFIAAGDLEQTIKRIEKLQAASDERGGYVGMYL